MVPGLILETSDTRNPHFVLRVDPHAWPAQVDHAAGELAALHANRRQHTDGPRLCALEAQLREWLAPELERLPERARLLVVQPAQLRPLDLALLLPGACGGFQAHWAITPIFTDRGEAAQIALALRRPPLTPRHVSFLRAAADSARSLDEKLVDLALAAARHAGATATVTCDGGAVLRFLRDPSSDVRVLIAHSPRANRITVGAHALELPDLSNLHGPVELDLSICHSTPWGTALAPKTAIVTSCSSTVALHDIACVHAELWTGRLRRQRTTSGYFDSGFAYGEALVQAAALLRDPMYLNTDMALELLAQTPETEHDDLLPDRCLAPPRTPRRVARRVSRRFAHAIRRRS